MAVADCSRGKGPGKGEDESSTGRDALFLYVQQCSPFFPFSCASAIVRVRAHASWWHSFLSAAELVVASVAGGGGGGGGGGAGLA